MIIIYFSDTITMLHLNKCNTLQTPKCKPCLLKICPHILSCKELSTRHHHLHARKWSQLNCHALDNYRGVYCHTQCQRYYISRLAALLFQNVKTCGCPNYRKQLTVAGYFKKMANHGSVKFSLKNKFSFLTRTLTLEPHTACRKGGWGLEYKIKRN